MKKTILLMAILGFVLNKPSTIAQEAIQFSLEEAIQYGLQNNISVKNTKKDIEIARKKVHETTAIGLPQINGKLSNTNYLNTATTLMPDFITPQVIDANKKYFDLDPTPGSVPEEFGTFPVSFGQKYNALAEISASQLIFNGSYLVGLQAAKTFLKQSKIQFEKSNIDFKESISAAYFLVLVVKKNKSILITTLENLKSTYKETNEVFKQGFIEDTEVDQLKLMIDDLETNLLYIENQIILSESQLKVLLGIDFTKKIELTDNLDQLIKKIEDQSILASNFIFSKNIDYRIIENQRELSELNFKNEKANYLPVLSAFFTAQANAMRDSYNIFDKNQPWYPTTLWGIQMDIPIFSSGSRSSKVKQAKLELIKIEDLELELKNQLKTAEVNTRANFKNALAIHQNKKNASNLAFRIYFKTQLKYKEGVSSSMDLLQAYNQYLEAEGNYINSIIDLVNAKLALEKLFAE